MQPTNSESTVPGLWPGAFGIFKISQKAVMSNLGPIVAFVVLSGCTSAIVSITSRSARGNLSVQLIGLAISVLLGAFISAAGTVIYLAAAKGKKVDLGAALSRATQLYLQFLLVNVLLYATLIFGIILLVIPALVFVFFFLPRLALTYYFIADEEKNLNAIDAISASWKATKGNVGKVWGLVGAELLFVLPVFTIIGILLTIYLYIMYSAAFPLLYLHLTREPASQPVAPIPPQPPMPQYPQNMPPAPQPPVV